MRLTATLSELPNLFRRQSTPDQCRSVLDQVEGRWIIGQALGLGAILTTLQLQFETETEGRARGAAERSFPVPCCRSAGVDPSRRVAH